MTTQHAVWTVLALVLAAGAVLGAHPAEGESPAREALQAAIERGGELYAQAWSEGGKTCAQCHAPGPNKMRAARLKSYPKWDKLAGKVVTGQQKLRAMIVNMGKGEAPELGSDDLNALEAYVSTLR